MRVLVTGGAGFLGSHLVRALRARGAQVRVLDDLSTGSRANLPAEQGCRRGDVRCRAHVERALAGADRVFHLAAAVGPTLVASDPRGTWSRNVEGTAQVVEACRRAGVPLLFASSSEVYLPAEGGRRLRESDPVGADPRDRRAVYARSKLVGEALVLAAARRHGLSVRIVRLFNVVGPRQSARHGMVVARFARALRAGRPLPVYGDGRQRRCFLHVRDAVRALLAVANTPGTRGRVLNVGSDEEVSIRSLARRMVAAAGHDPGLRFLAFEDVHGARFGDPRRRRPDVGRLTASTGWRRRLGLDDAIAEVIRGGVPPAAARRCSRAR